MLLVQQVICQKSIKSCKSIPIPIPPVDEQAEILRIYHEVNKREVQLK